jgi:Bacterial Ig-like domain (group 2)
LKVGDQQQLSVSATYSDGSQKDVTATSTWSDANQTVATVDSTGLVSALAVGAATITATDVGLTSSSAITVSGGGSNQPVVNIPTWHDDNQRSGLNANETILTPTNVNSQSFGKLFSYFVDGYVYAQPLYVSNLSVNGAMHNVVYVATENDSVYAFDADHPGDGSALWKISLLASGETPIAGGGSILPYVGITSTPTIDLASSTMYVVTAQDSGTSRFFRLHALDLATGAEKLGGPVVISASVPGTNSEAVNGVITLTTSCLQRAALLLVNNAVIIGFGSCHSGWLLSYNAQNLSQIGVFNMSPNMDGYGNFASAGGVWMGGGGPAADSNGNIYVTTGNGPYDGISAFSDSAIKFDTQLHLLDNFTPFDYAFLGCKDTDLAAGGILLIPGTAQALVGGKSGKLYMVNTSNMGGSQANDAGATQTLWFEDDLSGHYSATCTDPKGNAFTGQITSYEIFATAAFFNGSVYLGVTPTAAVPAPVRQFTYANGQLTPSAFTANSISEGSYGTTPFISANGTSNGIVWMIDHGAPIRNSGDPTAAVLHAYDANNLAIELYNSSQNSADTAGFGMKFTSPIVANGKVFIGTARDALTTTNPSGELDVYGLKN